MTVVRTQSERYAEALHTLTDQAAEIAALKKACASALSVIEGMRASSRDIDLAFAPGINDEDDDENPNAEWLFGAFTRWTQFTPDEAGYESRCIVEWPDLDLAAQHLRKVLG